MPTIFDHVKYYRNRSFKEVPFSDVDALALTELTFLKLDADIVAQFPLTLEELGKLYFTKTKKKDLKGKYIVYISSYNLFLSMYDAPRYKKIIVSDYAKEEDKNTQFGAITFRYFSKWVYVNFEGTNDSITGWKEDFLLASEFPLVCQHLASEYLKNTIKLSDKNIYVGGHSKGANLAIASVLLSPPIYRQKITKIYDFDGPGFQEKVFNSKAYQSIIKKIIKYVPELSCVGMILYSVPNPIAVKSNARGILQHDGCSWECYGSYLVEGELNSRSLAFRDEIKGFVHANSEESLDKLVKKVFSVLEAAEITSIEKISISKIVKGINYAKELKTDEETKNKLIKLLNMILSLYKI